MGQSDNLLYFCYPNNTFMKTIALLLLSFFFGQCLFAVPNVNNEPTPNPIPIVRGELGDHTKTRPRSIVDVPLTCIYKAGQVELCFLEELGEAEIVVTSLTTGEQWSTVADTAAGVVIVAVSEEAGEYVVQIHAAGDAWHGCYTIE